MDYLSESCHFCHLCLTLYLSLDRHRQKFINMNTVQVVEKVKFYNREFHEAVKTFMVLQEFSSF